MSHPLDAIHRSSRSTTRSKFPSFFGSDNGSLNTSATKHICKNKQSRIFVRWALSKNIFRPIVREWFGQEQVMNTLIHRPSFSRHKISAPYMSNEINSVDTTKQQLKSCGWIYCNISAPTPRRQFFPRAWPPRWDFPAPRRDNGFRAWPGRSPSPRCRRPPRPASVTNKCR